MNIASIPIWSLHDAKNRLSEVIQRAQQEGPQTITRHGRPVAIVAPVQAQNPGDSPSAWDLLRDDLIASLGGPPELPSRIAEVPVEVPLPW